MKGTTAWFWALFTLLFTRGMLFATWSTRGPEVQKQLGFDLQSMGWYAACLSLGAILGVLVSEHLVRRLGSRVFSQLSYTIMGTALILLALVVSADAIPLVFVASFLLGLPLGLADYDNNLGAANITRVGGKNYVPALSGGYSVGVMVGSGLAGVAITMSIGLLPDFVMIGLIAILLAILFSFGISRDEAKALPASEKESNKAQVSLKSVLSEKRSRSIAVIAFAFVFTEAAGIVWIPIALVQEGYSPALAAFGYTLFGLGFVIMRFVGGPIADKIGRRNVVLFSAILAALGIGFFILTPLIQLPVVGVLLWGLGDSIGLSMCIAAMGDDEARVTSRMRFLMLVVYLANLVVGPLIGLLSGIGGLLIALLTPLPLLIAAALLSKSVSETHPDAMVTEKVASSE